MMRVPHFAASYSIEPSGVPRGKGRLSTRLLGVSLDTETGKLDDADALDIGICLGKPDSIKPGRIRAPKYMGNGRWDGNPFAAIRGGGHPRLMAQVIDRVPGDKARRLALLQKENESDDVFVRHVVRQADAFHAGKA